MEKQKLPFMFTTPDQSYRLIKAGVPEITADCYYKTRDFGEAKELYGATGEWDDLIKNGYVWPLVLSAGNNYSLQKDAEGFHTMPCWSVGRLFWVIMLINKIAHEKAGKDLPESETNWLYFNEYITIRADRYNVENIVAWIEEINRAEIDIYLLLGGIEYE